MNFDRIRLRSGVIRPFNHRSHCNGDDARKSLAPKKMPANAQGQCSGLDTADASGRIRILVLVFTAQKFSDTRRKAVAETWLPCTPNNVSVLFVEGGHAAAEIRGDTLRLSCGDGYDDLARKAHEAFSFCKKNLVFDYLFKCDDDSYVDLERLAIFVSECASDYTGYPCRGPFFTSHRPYALGCGYLLSALAVDAIVAYDFGRGAHSEWWWYGPRNNARFPHGASVEDMMTGHILAESGIRLRATDRFWPRPFPTPRHSKTLISCHGVSPILMRRIHSRTIGRNPIVGLTDICLTARFLVKKSMLFLHSFVGRSRRFHGFTP